MVWGSEGLIPPQQACFARTHFHPHSTELFTIVSTDASGGHLLTAMHVTFMLTSNLYLHFL